MTMEVDDRILSVKWTWGKLILYNRSLREFLAFPHYSVCDHCSQVVLSERTDWVKAEFPPNKNLTAAKHWAHCTSPVSTVLYIQHTDHEELTVNRNTSVIILTKLLPKEKHTWQFVCLKQWDVIANYSQSIHVFPFNNQGIKWDSL